MRSHTFLIGKRLPTNVAKHIFVFQACRKTTRNDFPFVCAEPDDLFAASRPRIEQERKRTHLDLVNRLHMSVDVVDVCALILTVLALVSESEKFTALNILFVVSLCDPPPP